MHFWGFLIVFIGTLMLFLLEIQIPEKTNEALIKTKWIHINNQLEVGGKVNKHEKIKLCK